MELFWVSMGIILGSIVTNIIYLIRCVHGTLKIDRSDPSKDKYRLVIDNLDSLNKRSSVMLKIEHDADLSQE